MVRLRLPARRPALLPSTLATIAIFSTTTLAQRSNDPENEEETTTRGNAPAPTPEEEEENEDPSPTTTGGRNNNGDEETPTSSGGNAVITGGEEVTNLDLSSTPSTTSDGAVAVTGGAADSATASEEDFPTLVNGPLDYTYPAAAVPPTIDAPFMHRSTAPEGTVFIVVGAILGAFGLGILLWRGIVACLLHRSVRRAAMEQHVTNDKASFPAPPAQFYKYSDHNSSLSLAGGSAIGKGTRRTNRGPIPSATPSQSNLFFSPTAAHGAGGNANARDSRFLPSGFYAAGNSSPGPNHTHSISLTNLRPDSRGMGRGMREVTPPDSPQFAARRDMSTSSLNLSAPGQQGNRAPSAYLEDLLDENPQAFPPSQMPPPNPQRSPGPRY